MKTCPKCGCDKQPGEFSRNASRRDGLSSWCKECNRISAADRYAANSEVYLKRSSVWRETNMDMRHEYDAAYYAANRAAILARKKVSDRAYYDANREKVSARVSAYSKQNHAKKAEYTRALYADSVQFRLGNVLRSRLNCAVRGGVRAGSAVRDLGGTIDELKAHLESQFKPGMTWENWTSDGWHIDHIIPLVAFDLTAPEQLKQACHYTNLRPLWARDNLSKGGRKL